VSYALNNVTTQDAYTAATTLDLLPPCSRVNLDVNNTAIYWSVKLAVAGTQLGAWGPDVFMSPGSRTLQRSNIVGIRVRSAVAGKPAQVTAECVPAGEG